MWRLEDNLGKSVLICHPVSPRVDSDSQAQPSLLLSAQQSFAWDGRGGSGDSSLGRHGDSGRRKVEPAP